MVDHTALTISHNVVFFCRAGGGQEKTTVIIQRWGIPWPAHAYALLGGFMTYIHIVPLDLKVSATPLHPSSR